MEGNTHNHNHPPTYLPRLHGKGVEGREQKCMRKQAAGSRRQGRQEQKQDQDQVQMQRKGEGGQEGKDGCRCLSFPFPDFQTGVTRARAETTR